ncbi:MAG TPA: hypothetical protein PL143_06630 [Rhodocyclaceae bacterium]|nr:hypothetical protein [Rhodocyclaceae bacterium]
MIPWFEPLEQVTQYRLRFIAGVIVVARHVVDQEAGAMTRAGAAGLCELAEVSERSMHQIESCRRGVEVHR